MASSLNITQDYVGGDYGRQATAAARPFKGVVIHVTGKPDLQSELDYMSHPDPNRPGYYGYHYLIDTDGSVYHTAPDNVRTNHIMPNSQFGLNNSNALGVAFVGGAKGATPEQINSGKALVGQLTSQFGIKPNMVVSHGELDPDTRGPGHGLGKDDTAEGADFINAYRGTQPVTGSLAGTNPAASPARPVSTTPGTTLNSTPMDLVANLESGNRNIAQQIKDKNSAAGTPAGGFFQIIDPTWRIYAAAAGVDVNQYPTAMSAPRDIQAKVASAIPVNQWGPNTVAALKAKYPGIDTSQTLGAVQSAAINPSGAPTTVVGAPAAPAPGQPGQAPGGWAGKLASALKPPGPDKGGDSGGEEPPPLPSMPMPQAQAMGGPMMMRPGQQNTFGRAVAEQSLGQQGYMMQPTLAAFGGGGEQPPVASTIGSTISNMAPGQASGMPALPGTTLNSPSQLQMALMSGSISPYDMYARNAAYGGGLGS